MTSAVLTALLASALAGIDGTAVDLQLSGRADATGRVLVRPSTGPQQVAQLDAVPRLSLLLDRERTLRAELQYEPQLRLSHDVAAGVADARIEHGGLGRVTWDVAPVWRISGSARGSIRVLDFASPSGTELARLLDLRAPPSAVRYLETGASAGVEGRPTRLVTVGSSVAVESSGGLGADGRVAIPGLRQVRLAGSVARDQTRVDVVRLEGSVTAASFQAGGTASLATLGGAWMREATSRLRFRLAAAASRGVGAGDGVRLIPGGEAAVEYSPAFLGAPLRIHAALRAGPAVDRYGADLQRQIGTDADVSWSPTVRWTFGAAGAAGRVDDRNGFSASRGELRAAWHLSPRVTLSAALWSEWQRDPRLAEDSTVSYWGSRVGVELAPIGRLAP